MKKALRKIHLWLSVPFGLIITVICFSGAALVFEDEVMELCRRDLYYVEKVSGAPLPVEYLIEKVSETLPDGVAVTGISISSDAERACRVSLSKPRRASVYVDQYTGEVKGRYERAPFFLTMFRLHRWLLDSMKPDGGIFWGKMIVGVSTLMFVFVLVSGIVIWWPRTKKALKNSLKIVADKGRLRFWHDLHVAGGMYVLILLLAMALTGLTWSFPWYRAGFYKVFGVEAKQGTGHHDAPQATATSYACWQQVYEELKERNDGYKQITVSNGSATVSFERFGNQRASDRYTFNPSNGEITGTALYKDADASGKIRGWIYSVHVGSWGGMFTRVLTFIAALLGGTLPLTGYYLWIRRIGRKAKAASFSPDVAKVVADMFPTVKQTVSRWGTTCFTAGNG